MIRLLLSALLVAVIAALSLGREGTAAAAPLLRAALPPLLFALLLWLAALLGRRWGKAWYAEPLPAAPGGPGWVLAGAAVLSAAFILLETLQPYYFTQDDALVINLPGILHGCRSAWQGTFAEYNPYTLFGSPHATLGLYALTYPPTYLSYAIARHGLGDEMATLEVFAILHLTIGYFLTCVLARRLGQSAPVASLAALSFTLSGALLIMGRGWFMFLPLAVWLPLLTWGVVHLRQAPVTWAWSVGMGLALGMAFQVGFPQLAFYTLAYPAVLLLALTLCADLPWRRAATALPALVIGIGLSIPLGLQQWLAARDMIRHAPYGAGILHALPGMLFPYPLAEAAHPMDWGSTGTRYMGHFLFFGGLFVGLLLLHAFALLGAGRAAVWRRQQTWFFLAFVTFLLALGNEAGLWWVLCRVPVLGRVSNHPFRMLPFFVFFAVLAGGLVLERILRHAPALRRGGALLWGGAVAILLYHVVHAQTAFYTYGFRPYPELPPTLQAVLRAGAQPTGRLISWAPERSVSPSLPFSMCNMMPQAYELPAYSGFDPLVQRSGRFQASAVRLVEDPDVAFRAYGIRWHLDLLPEARMPSAGAGAEVVRMEGNPFLPEAEPWFRAARLPVAATAAGVAIHELAGPAPLAFAASAPEKALPIRMHGGGIDVDVAGGAAGPVVINFLYYPQMHADLDGQALACTEDEWQRIVVDLPGSGQVLHLRFRSSWGQGILLGAAVALLGLFLIRLSRGFDIHDSVGPAPKLPVPPQEAR